MGDASRSAPVSTTRGARDSDSDDEEDVSGRAPSRSGELFKSNQRACEVRRVGDKKWRRFSLRESRPDRRRRGVPRIAPRASDISKLINSPAKSNLRLIVSNPRNLAPRAEAFEARNVGDDAPRRPRSPPVSAAALAAAARGPPEESDEEDSEDEDERRRRAQLRKRPLKNQRLREPPRRGQEVAPLRVSEGRRRGVPRIIHDISKAHR